MSLYYDKFGSDWKETETMEIGNSKRTSQREKTKALCQYVGMALLMEAEIKRVVFHKQNAGLAVPSTKTIQVPRPTTRRRLYLLAHEVGHVVLGHRSKKPVHREEYEAEKYAHDAFKRHGVAVPQWSSDNAKRYVAWKIRQALQNGAKRIDRDAFHWCEGHLDGCMTRKRLENVILEDMS